MGQTGAPFLLTSTVLWRKLAGQVMTPKIPDEVREYLAKLARKGGKARAEKYDKATLSKWAKKGGRPPKKDKKK
jgi:hypothetical protein